MPYELIITEKPAAAEKIASALASGKPIKENEKGVPYYKITHDKKDIVVASAVGHLFTIAEKNKTFEYPSFDVEWVASSDNNKESAFTKKYLSLLKKLSKGAKSFTIATDYDVEGEVIGVNVLRYACNQKDASRMKFSTLTKEDLIEAYENKSPSINWGQANAGLTRHELDWYYGINLSRALTSSIKSIGRFKIMSSGRVQGPALKIIVDREREIGAFKPVPYWEVDMEGKVQGKDIKATHVEDKFWEKEKASLVVKKTKGKEAIVDEVKKKEFSQQPPTPFDLTTLQTESYRCFGISPKDTLSIAQELYTSGLISYPRTSSQKLSEKIGFRKIMSMLARSEHYKVLADRLMSLKDLKPNNGKKDDPAHPAIYPTGVLGNVEGRNLKVYDLIVKRFLATFGEPAVRETVSLDINCNGEHFISKGTRTTKQGWHIYYMPYVDLEEQELPSCSKGDKVDVKSIKMEEKETQPPKRYTPASIIKELEKRNLGTKATRAAIVDTLFDRKYVAEKAIMATDLGIKTIETLEKYSPRILDEELTRHFEEEMDEIREDKKKPGEVLIEAKDFITDTLVAFKKKEKEVGTMLIDAYRETQNTENTLGQCPLCKNGNLMLKKGKFGRFIACSDYPQCKETFKIPQVGTIKSTKKPCEICSHPVISLYKKGAKPQKLCINPGCSSKVEEGTTQEKNHNDEIGRKCPTCGSKLLLRKSIYGQFIGCSGYPKCKYTEKVNGSAPSPGDNLL